MFTYTTAPGIWVGIWVCLGVSECVFVCIHKITHTQSVCLLAAVSMLCEIIDLVLRVCTKGEDSKLANTSACMCLPVFACVFVCVFVCVCVWW